MDDAAVTEQIDALASMASIRSTYLVVPRFLACLLLIPALTIMADLVGFLGGAGYSVYFLHIDPSWPCRPTASSACCTWNRGWGR